MFQWFFLFVTTFNGRELLGRQAAPKTPRIYPSGDSYFHYSRH